MKRRESPLKRTNPSGSRGLGRALHQPPGRARRSAGTYGRKHEAQDAIDARLRGPRSAARRRRSAPTTRHGASGTRARPGTNRTNDCRIRQVLDLELDGRRLRDWPFRELRRRHAHDLVDHLLRVQGRAHTGAQNILRALSAMAEDAITDEIAEVNWVRGVRVRASDPRVTGEHPAAAGVQLRRHARLRREGRGERADAQGLHRLRPQARRGTRALAPGLRRSTLSHVRGSAHNRTCPPRRPADQEATSARSPCPPSTAALIRAAAEADRHAAHVPRPLTGRDLARVQLPAGRLDTGTRGVRGRHPPARLPPLVDHPPASSRVSMTPTSPRSPATRSTTMLGTYTHALGRSHQRRPSSGAGAEPRSHPGRIRALIPRRQSGSPPASQAKGRGFEARRPLHPRLLRALPVLLPQPGGFEGRGPLCELVHADDLAVADRVDVEQPGVDLDPASSTTSPQVQRHDHAIALVDELLVSHLVLVPRAFPARQAGPNRIVPRADASSTGFQTMSGAAYTSAFSRSPATNLRTIVRFSCDMARPVSPWQGVGSVDCHSSALRRLVP